MLIVWSRTTARSRVSHLPDECVARCARVCASESGSSRAFDSRQGEKPVTPRRHVETRFRHGKTTPPGLGSTEFAPRLPDSLPPSANRVPRSHGRAGVRRGALSGLHGSWGKSGRAARLLPLENAVSGNQSTVGFCFFFHECCTEFALSANQFGPQEQQWLGYDLYQRLMQSRRLILLAASVWALRISWENT